MGFILVTLQVFGVMGCGGIADDERGRRILESTKMYRELLDSGTVFLKTTTNWGKGVVEPSTYRCDFEGPKFRVAYLSGPRANPKSYGGRSPSAKQPWTTDLWDGSRLITRQFAGSDGMTDAWQYLTNDSNPKNITNFFYPPTLGLLPFHGLNVFDMNRATGLNGHVTRMHPIEGTSLVELSVESHHSGYDTTNYIKLVIDSAKDDNVVHYEFKVTPNHGEWNEGYRGDVELQQVDSHWYPRKVTHHSLMNGEENVTLTIEVTNAQFGVSFPQDYFSLDGMGYQPFEFLMDIGDLPNG